MVLAAALLSACGGQPDGPRDLDRARRTSYERLPPGADLLLLRPEAGAFALPESFGASLPGRAELVPEATSHAGVTLSRMTYKHRQISPMIRWTVDPPFEHESDYARSGYEPGLCVSKLNCLVHSDGTQIRDWRDELAVEQRDARGRRGFEGDRALYIGMFTTLYPDLAVGFATLAGAFTVEVSVAADRAHRLELSLYGGFLDGEDERALLGVCSSLASNHTHEQDGILVCTGSISECDVELRLDFDTYVDSKRGGSGSVHLRCA